MYWGSVIEPFRARVADPVGSVEAYPDTGAVLVLVAIPADNRHGRGLYAYGGFFSALANFRCLV
jgi:hypothetical protein